MHLLALALLCWIAGACLTIGYIANVAKSTAVALDDSNDSLDRFAVRIDGVSKRIDVVDRIAAQGAMAAKASQKAIDEHLKWVEDRRLESEKAAKKARRAFRGR